MQRIKNIKNLLGRKEVPYLLTLLVALLVYFLNDIVGSYKKSPALIYNIKTVESKTVDGQTEEHLECTLRNAGCCEMLKEVYINMQYPTDLQVQKDGIFAYLHDPEIIPVAPASNLQDSTGNNFGWANVYFLKTIQPNSEYILKARSVHHATITQKPKLYITSPEPIRLIGGHEAWLVNNAMNIQWILVGVLFIILLIYLSHISTQKES